jgi:hypothetical protein
MKNIEDKIKYPQPHNIRKQYKNYVNIALRDMEIEYEHHMAKYKSKYLKGKHSRRLYQ